MSKVAGHDSKKSTGRHLVEDNYVTRSSEGKSIYSNKNLQEQLLEIEEISRQSQLKVQRPLIQ